MLLLKYRNNAMIRNIAFTITLFVFLPFTMNAQKTNKKNKAVTQVQTPLPEWAASHHYDATAHAYFPDYYTFYDAKRGGYVFWENGKWTFTPTMPAYLSKTELSKTRVQILKGVDLDLQPQLNYPQYMKLYPPVQGSNYQDIPVPVPSAPDQVKP